MPAIKEFRESSTKFNKSLSKEDRAAQGIYFTPKKARDLLFEKLAEAGVTPQRILEPSFGSGEFIHDARRLYPDAHILGVEKNSELFNSVSCSNSTLTCADFLTWEGKADLILGNPLYFLMKTGETAAARRVAAAKVEACMIGRPNIFVLFLYKCLEQHLEDGGFLAFIIPTSIYNCSYYQPMRNYIRENTTIRCVETLDRPGFFETGQETTLLILEKKPGGTNFLYTPKTGNTYITPFYKELEEITKGATTLDELGLAVKTGNVVWNQVKDKLSADPGTLLIYSSNINNSELKLNNLLGNEKKQYVKGIDKPTLDGPVILVERGYGNSFRFNSVLVREKGFYAENHLNVIYPLEPKNVRSAGKLKRVADSFKDERSTQFVKMFLGNGSMTATDLQTLMPIF